MLSLFLLIVIVLVHLGNSAAWQMQGRSTANLRASMRLNMLGDGRRALIGGNWKLNPTTVAQAESLASALAHQLKGLESSIDTVVFPPFPLLPTVRQQLQNSGVRIGAQDVFYETSGAFTGGVSTALLKDMGVAHVLVGHSERRSIFGESDETINKKVRKLVSEGMTAVLCIGESKDEYEAGLNQQVCALQLLKGLRHVTKEQMKHVVLAYEPVWAIGTGLTCPKENAQDVHAYIRSLLAQHFDAEVARSTVIMYGGSVNAGNARELMQCADIDGLLVGGASLNADTFGQVVRRDK
eukprot:gene33465-40488_t